MPFFYLASSPEKVTIDVAPRGNVLVSENATVSFTCELTCGCSGTQLTWQRGGGVLPSATMYGGRVAVLSLGSVRKSDEGAYTCVANNSLLGVASADVLLQVNVTDSK